MPPPPVSAAIDAFLREPNPAVIGTVRPDGSPHTVATWYDWDGELVLLNMDASRRRLEFMRRDPRVSLTVLDRESWYRHVSLRVASSGSRTIQSLRGSTGSRSATTDGRTALATGRGSAPGRGSRHGMPGRSAASTADRALAAPPGR
jgi:hypothetical protein